MPRSLATILIIAGVGGAAYVWREPLHVFAGQLYGQVLPCTWPITYSLGAIDPRFNISESDIVNVLDGASGVWESALDRDLFVYQPHGGALTINFVYDARQETTSALRSLDAEISGDREAYDVVRAEYQEMLAAYEAARARLESDAAVLRKDSAAYEAEVARINARGGARPNEYDRLQQEKAALAARQSALETRRDALNAQASAVNAKVKELNQLAGDVNAGASTYNAVAEGHDEEFEEAVYQSAPGTQEIDVFEFDSRARLSRVLSHEFGHALGLEHVVDPEAIMHRLNQGTSHTPTSADIAELRAACRLAS